MIDYFDFSKNDSKVFIPKSKQLKKSTTFDKFHKSTIHSSSLDKYAKYLEEVERERKKQDKE